MTGPTLSSVVGDELPPEEQARLERVHELLLAAGPPAELPPSLATAPDESAAQVIPLHRRFRYTLSTAAAVAAAVLFGVGYLVGGGSGEPTDRVVAMAGPAGAEAQLSLLAKDEAGNWPMKLEVEGLPPLPEALTYELWLTKDGELAEPCGTFAIAEGSTTVSLNAPYPLRKFTGWVVVETGSREFLLRTETV